MLHGWEDWDFWVSLLKPEDKVIKIDEPLFLYRQKITSMLNTMDVKKQEDMRKTVFLNHTEKYINEFGNPIDFWRKEFNIFYKGPKQTKQFTKVKNKIKGLLLPNSKD